VKSINIASLFAQFAVASI